MLKETILYKVTKWLFSFYRWLMLESSLTLTEPLPAGPKIFVANHPNSLDPFYVFSLLPEQVSALIGGDFFHLFLLGKLFALSGHIPVEEGKGQQVLSLAKEKIRQGQNVLIFLEGKLSSDVEQHHKPKTGAVRLALMTGAPIVPLGIFLDPKRSKIYKTQVNGDDKKGVFYLRGPYHVVAGEALTIKGGVEDRKMVRKKSEEMKELIKHLVAKNFKDV